MLIGKGLWGTAWGAAFGSLCSFMWCASESQSATTLGQTRVIVFDAARRASITVKNQEDLPVLVQAWVDEDGESETPPAVSTIPFVLDPPVMRLEPGQTRTIGALLTRVPQHLPKDRESLFWFNVLEVPALPADEAHGQARLDVSVLSRLKLFYRPAALADVRYQVNKHVTVAPLTFRLENEKVAGAAGGKRLFLVIENPAPIHQTLSRLVLNDDIKLEPTMVAPFETVRLRVYQPLGHSTLAAASVRLDYTLIDDDGNLGEREATLTKQ